MKLTRLELSGFKSFADTVTLAFDEGVTAIVGPNGCGKSNVSDAVRWVLGEQSARQLRGAKMDDVIFQGAATRRPVNVTDVSLYLDNSDGQLPTPYTEVVITRRLSRSGQSDYLLNNAPVRLRDIQDLLRGTGLGSDAGVVIEARMIDLLLSDRADERRSLFEEAAGIGLYRDRRHATARRLDDTAADLQRVDDLIAEVQSQVRSLARQKGKAERHAALTDERFSVTLALARRRLAQWAADSQAFLARHLALSRLLPETRAQLGELATSRDAASTRRQAAERHRAAIADELTTVRLDLGRLDGELAVAGERLAHLIERRDRSAVDRDESELRLQRAGREREMASDELASVGDEQTRVAQELSARAALEDQVRARLAECREQIRQLEHQLQHAAEQHRSLEGERSALDGELASLRQRQGEDTARRAHLEGEHELASAAHTDAQAQAERRIADARHATAAAEQARLRVRETQDRDTREAAARRALEEEVGVLAARQSALESLERDRVGLAPGAAALLAERQRFNGGVIGPLTDFLTTDREQAELAEQLLGQFAHAILVRDDVAISSIRQWHADVNGGALILLPLDPGPGPGRADAAIDPRLTVEPPAREWFAALTGGSEVLAEGGRVLRRPSGAVYLAGPSTGAGPIRRRAELKTLRSELASATAALAQAEQRRVATTAELAELDLALAATATTADAAVDGERAATAVRDDAARMVATLERELTDAATQLERFAERLNACERRRLEVDSLLTSAARDRDALGESLRDSRTALSALESEQEQARDARSEWQVQEVHLSARVRTASDLIERARQTIAEAEQAGRLRADEMVRFDRERGELEMQRSQWQGEREGLQLRVTALELAASEAETALATADAALTTAEADLTDVRQRTEAMTDEHHRLELSLADATSQRQRLVERVEAEWKRPFDVLIEAAPDLDLDLDALELEAERVAAALETIGPVNPLALEEHAEESRRLTFLQTQRDDLAAARQALLQAITEIDGTARALFETTFDAVRANFVRVFQTLFGGGECELRLSDPTDPLESEIEIHAAPRGKRTQRIHLLSSGERTLVAVSLLFSIYLTKPSPFCLMDEVDAPLDDANVGRFLLLLDEFKAQTQFLVITHNPRTMQAADTVFGVTMQEPGVSTIVGVRIAEHQAA